MYPKKQMTQTRAAKSPIDNLLEDAKPSVKKDKRDKKDKKSDTAASAGDKKAGKKEAGKKDKKKKNPLHKAAAAEAKANRHLIQVRQSGVHGKGVFATEPIAKGEVLIEYKGDVITWKEALRRHPHDPSQPDHTFFFHIDDKHVIDGNANGNDARWINHACDPNCEADEVDGKIFIKSLRKLKADQELFYDYGLVIDGRLTKKLKKRFECRCGAESCRGTMLAPKDKS
jgi:FKBP-type peptidyl-prolyl cis-trans isomerase